MKHRTLLTIAFLVLASVSPSIHGKTSIRQEAFDPASMSLEESVAWLKKTLLGLGRQRLALTATYLCDSGITGVAMDRGILTINLSETCSEGHRQYTQKLTYEIPIADVDAGKCNVVEVEDHEHVKGFNVHVVMATGKKVKTKQVLIENGKTTGKGLEYSSTEIYIKNRNEADRTVDVLRRMVTLSSSTTSGEKRGDADTAVGDAEQSVQSRLRLYGRAQPN